MSTRTTPAWVMDLTDAKEAMVAAMRDAASTPEEVEVYVYTGYLIRAGHVDELVAWRKREHDLAQRRVQRARCQS